MENQETVIQNTFDIPECNMDRLNSEVAKLNRRAANLGVDPISVNVVDTYFVRSERARIEHWMTKTDIENLPKDKFFTIEIIGKGPKIEGYKFIGTLDHNTIPGSVIVQAVPGETVPGTFFNASTVCDHCNKKRSRSETFVVEKEDGTYMQVGRSCLRDFFGHEPERIARFLSRVISFVAELRDDDWGYDGTPIHYLNGLSVLKDTFAMIRTYGWVARSSAGYESVPTADQVRYLLMPNIRNEEQRLEYEKFAATIKYDDGDAMEAIKALNWLDEQTGDSSYIHNLKTLAKSDHVPVNMLGYWCSVVSAYQREMDKLELAKQENILKLNEYLGEIKQRVDMDVTVTGISYTPGNFGTVTVVRMLDSEGRTVVWFANTDVELEKGGKYKVKATIKKHEEYRDWKQTQVNRLKVIEEVATA